MKIIKYLAYALVIVGALNWGLVGLFNYNLVSSIFGDMSVLSRITYSLVGLSAFVMMFSKHHSENIVEEEICECTNCGL